MTGRTRTAAASDLHDRVIAEATDNLIGGGYDVGLNPGSVKRFAFADTLYPDLIVGEFTEMQTGSLSIEPSFVIEVETSDSVTAAEAERQWKPYANAAFERHIDFILIVPVAEILKAEDLCERFDVAARVIGYTESARGVVVIDWEGAGL